MTKRQQELQRLAGRINKFLHLSKELVVYEHKGKYTVKTVKNKTVIDGFDYRDTELVMRGMLEASKLIKTKK